MPVIAKSATAHQRSLHRASGDPSSQSEDRPAEARDRILDAALKVFSADGLAGARTEQIAASAGVNKALIYYYFESKEKLYLAAIEAVAARVRNSSMAVMNLKASAGERLLRTALNHFDRVLTQREFQSLMQQEMIRLHKGEASGEAGGAEGGEARGAVCGEAGAIPVLFKRVFEPLMTAFQTTVREGIESGEIIDADLMQFSLVAMGANVFYFLSAPIWGMMHQFDPFHGMALQTRRVALVEFLGQAIFTNRSRGAKLAERVLADTPMPASIPFR